MTRVRRLIPKRVKVGACLGVLAIRTKGVVGGHKRYNVSAECKPFGFGVGVARYACGGIVVAHARS